MKRIKISLILLAVFCTMCFTLIQNSSANDTDLYLSSGEGVEPNILIMFDNSGSMGDFVPAPPYYNDHGYAVILANMDPPIVPQVSAANRDVVYSCNNSGSCTTVYKNNISQVLCAAVQTALTNSGYYQGRIKADSSCSTKNSDQTYTLRTGNYIDYLQYKTNDPTFNQTKLQTAKNVVNDFVNNIDAVRVGVMIFNTSEGGKIQSNIMEVDDSSRATLTSRINAINASTWTPLAETLYEAGRYYKGGPSYFNNGVVYTSPIQYSCQRNYVIIITDGDSTQDQNAILKTITNGFPGKSNGDMDGDGFEPPRETPIQVPTQKHTMIVLIVALPVLTQIVRITIVVAIMTTGQITWMTLQTTFIRPIFGAILMVHKM